MCRSEGDSGTADLSANTFDLDDAELLQRLESGEVDIDELKNLCEVWP